MGPIYIPKSKRSWSRRMRQRGLLTVALWLVWSLLPRTLLMRWGHWFPDRELQSRYQSLVAELGLQPPGDSR